MLAVLTLISILFFGGTQELFLIENLENGTKNLSIDKAKQDSILVELKSSKSYIIEYNKEGKNEVKLFKKINEDRSSNRDEFTSFYSNLTKTRVDFQEELIKNRFNIVELYTEEQWNSILKTSTSSKNESENKELRENINSNFDLIKQAVLNTVVDSSSRKAILDTTQLIQERYIQLSEKVVTLYSNDNAVIRDINSSKDDLLALYKEANSLSQDTYKALVDLHFILRTHCSENEWSSIIKEVNKLLE